jgi:hypothetical protein
MLAFRKAARAAAAENPARELTQLRRQPGFVEWFLDSVIPRPMNGERRLLPLPQQAAPTTGGDIRPPAAPAPKKRTHRESEVVQAFCYVEYRLKKRTRERVWNDAQKFGRRAPKRERHVTTLAARFATKYRLPLLPSDREREELLLRVEQRDPPFDAIGKR